MNVLKRKESLSPDITHGEAFIILVGIITFFAAVSIQTLRNAYDRQQQKESPKLKVSPQETPKTKKSSLNTRSTSTKQVSQKIPLYTQTLVCFHQVNTHRLLKDNHLHMRS